MRSARRVASVAAIAAVGILALSACRSQPGVAAYVGDHRITEDQVTSVVDDVQATAPQGSQVKPPSRGDVVGMLVLRQACQQLSADKGYSPQMVPTAEQIAQGFGVSPDSQYAQLEAEMEGCLSGLPAGTPANPTPEQLADVIARGREAGVIPAEVPDDQVAQQLVDNQLIGALTSSKSISDEISAYRVTINPRYRQLEYPLLRFRTESGDTVPAVGIPLGEGDADTVIDQR